MKDDLPRVVADAHWKKLTILARRFLADLGLPVVEVAFIYPDLSAEGTGGHVALKEGLILRPECVYRFHMVLFYEPQSYSRGDMGKRRGSPNAYYPFKRYILFSYPKHRVFPLTIDNSLAYNCRNSPLASENSCPRAYRDLLS